MDRLTAAIHYLIERLQEHDCPVSRLRLTKLLYLADWDSYLGSESRVTSVPWKFWLYGPWAAEVQESLDRMRGILADEVEGQDASGRGYYTYRSTTREGHASQYLSDGERVALDYVVRRYGSLPRNELLDHVYFGTAPMWSAERGQLLDFERGRREHLERWPRAVARKPSMPREAVARLMPDFEEAKQRVRRTVVSVATPLPRVDEVLEAALSVMAEEDRTAPVHGLCIDARDLDTRGAT